MPNVEIIDAGHIRERDLAIEMPRSPLTAVMANEVWTELYDRLAELIAQHRTTLIFVNQRRVAERAARHLAERLGEEHVTAHHGSLAREHRLDAEQRLKAGKLKALVATSSLELGIDIGDIDLVCQLGSPRAVNAFLQRVGRAGHAIGAIPKGRLFPLALDDLLECAALLDAVRRGELDRIRTPRKPLDALAQQIIAEAACREWPLDALYEQLRHAAPYRALTLREFEQVVQMLAEGYATRRGRRGAYLHYDAVNRVLRARRGARLAAVTNAGVIPDQFDYEVVLLPEEHRVGTLNEDFAFESLPGDIFQLGNTSYRIAKVETGKVLVEDAKGQPPSMPFWLGEGLGRTDELSHAVSRLSAEADALLQDDVQACERWLRDEQQLAGRRGATARAVSRRVEGRARRAADRTAHRVRALLRRGGRHAPGDPLAARLAHQQGLGAGAAQAHVPQVQLRAAGQCARRQHRALARADAQLCARRSAPLPQARQRARFAGAGAARRADVRHALALERHRVARGAAHERRPQGAAAVPAQRCARPADRGVPRPAGLRRRTSSATARSPTTRWWRRRCTTACTRRWTSTVSCGCCSASSRARSRSCTRDLASPSPLSHAILNARPYAFLDDGAAEERRTKTVATKALMDLQTAHDIGRLDPAGDRAGVRRRAARDRLGRRVARRVVRARIPHARRDRRAGAGRCIGAAAPRHVARRWRRRTSSAWQPSGCMSSTLCFPARRWRRRSPRCTRRRPTAMPRCARSCAAGSICSAR